MARITKTGRRTTLIVSKTGEVLGEASCGNVFADLGLPNPEEHLAKAKIVFRIEQILKKRKLNQTAAAKLLGLDQPKISALFRGRFRGYSLERLIRLLRKLDQEVVITIRPATESNPRGEIQVLTV